MVDALQAERERDDEGAGGESSDDGTVTEFSEPWDSTRWDRLLASPALSRRPSAASAAGRRPRLSAASVSGCVQKSTSNETWIISKTWH